ncbi:MAG: HAMP domain-containing protein, partial [Clostridiales bacterium]|nr:HAMP domain-containing protein [Clostridiales bacterium]
MSVRLRIITHSLIAILVLNAIGVAVGFLLFYLVGNPYLGERLNDNLGIISTRYFLLGAIVVLALTGIGALWLISVTVRHVTGPLQRLNRAASEIRDGNLGYELVVSGQDEFAELGAGFEQMRIRLKDSMWLQEKAEAERRTMMASVTHDLKTPITSIIGYAEGILDGVADTPEKTLEYAAVICKKARSLQALSEDLSLLSRLENAQLPLYKQEEDLGAIVYELANEFS